MASGLGHGSMLPPGTETIRHVVPRLGADTDLPLVADTTDAAGLRRMVEAQAIELVRLRRSLTAARSVAARRLALIRAGHGAQEEEDANPEQAAEKRGELIRAIGHIEEDIRSIIEGSRWRRIGQRVGLAKRLAWETGDWRSGLAGAQADAAGSADLSEAKERLLRLRQELAASRWRKLGQRLGVAKQQPWELEAPLPAPAPRAAPDTMPAADVASEEERWFPEHVARHFVDECMGSGAEVILDVGANTGQFAQGLRRSGYQGQIVSFEPLSEAHATLSEAAASDPLWDVVARCAVGAQEGQAEINIAANSYSSSLLPMLAAHEEAAPHSAYRDKESCAVITLDSFAARSFPDDSVTFGLKIDTQGFEAAVLAGAGRIMSQVRVVLCEMSLVPLYDGAPTMIELSRQLAAQGFRCVALGPAFEDPRTGDLLQIDGVFARRG